MKKVIVETSARHMHLSKEHLEILFGKGYELTMLKPLMGKEFAAKEVVTLVGKSLKSIVILSCQHHISHTFSCLWGNKNRNV